MENTTDEINLLEVSQTIIVRVYHYFVRRFKLLAIFAIIGAILGGVSYLRKRSTFENHIKVVTNSINPEVLAGLFNTLEDIRSTDLEAFGTVLGLDKAEAESVLEIAADTIHARAGGKQIVTIKTKFREGLVIKNFTNHLKDYVDRNSFVIKGIKLREISSKTLIKKYEKEIDKLTKLQEKILSSSSSAGQAGKVLLVDDKPINFFHNDILELEKNVISEKMELDFLQEGGFLIVDESEGTKVKRVSSSKTIIKFIGIFLAIGFLISLALEFALQAKHIEENKK